MPYATLLKQVSISDTEAAVLNPISFDESSPEAPASSAWRKGLRSYEHDLDRYMISTILVATTLVARRMFCREYLQCIQHFVFVLEA